jgi:hypothetical protein
MALASLSPLPSDPSNASRPTAAVELGHSRWLLRRCRGQATAREVLAFLKDMPLVRQGRVPEVARARDRPRSSFHQLANTRLGTTWATDLLVAAQPSREFDSPSSDEPRVASSFSIATVAISRGGQCGVGSAAQEEGSALHRTFYSCLSCGCAAQRGGGARHSVRWRASKRAAHSASGMNVGSALAMRSVSAQIEVSGLSRSSGSPCGCFTYHGVSR